MTIRIWSAGCSSGQEPYSMAMVLAESLRQHLAAEGRDLGQRPVARDAQDRRRRDLHHARRPGGFAGHGCGGSSCWAAGRARARSAIVPEIRDLVKFRHIDLRNPTWPVPTDFPIIFCRNVSIYFAEDERLDAAQPPGAAPAPGRLAGHGQRRDPAGGAAVAAQAFAVAVSEGGVTSHGSARPYHAGPTPA